MTNKITAVACPRSQMCSSIIQQAIFKDGEIQDHASIIQDHASIHVFFS
jgi:hypothetical protein